MAIQISESKLSDLARTELNKSKNKSQFLRDAIEYYVRRGDKESFTESPRTNNNNEKIEKDIREIKEMLTNLTTLPQLDIIKSMSVNNEKIEEISVEEIEENTEIKNIKYIDDDSKNEEIEIIKNVSIPSCYDY